MEKVEVLDGWQKSNFFDQRERAALDYTEGVTRSDIQVEDRHVEALRANFDNVAKIELTGFIAFQNLSSKFNSALDVPPQGFCKLPERTANSSNMSMTR